jgi:hypothetical protein
MVEAVQKEQYLFTNRRCPEIRSVFAVTERDRRSGIKILSPVFGEMIRHFSVS